MEKLEELVILYGTRNQEMPFVYKEIEPDLEKPFFYENAGCHICAANEIRKVFMGNSQFLFSFQTFLGPEEINFLKFRTFSF